MILEQLYTGCISHAAYYLESNGEVAFFDPLREVMPYIDKANKQNASIKYVFETHFHADFVSGHLDLAQQTGAKIVYGPNANPHFEAIIAKDLQIFEIGNCKVQALHTPGHTLESTTYLIFDENQKPHAIITGDTLFIGDVGRPDLAQKMASDLTQEKLAAMLFHSLRNKIMPLPDSILVYPNHGAGSACGKNMSKETFDTLGNQKKNNYALRADMTETEFVTELLNGLAAPPAYFPDNVLLNIQGYTSLDTVLQQAMTALNLADFREIMQDEDVLVLDVRHEDDFVKAHIPNALFIGLHGAFAPWVGAVLQNIHQKIVAIIPEGKEEETMIRLSRVGFDNCLGYLSGGFATWTAASLPTEHIASITPEIFSSEKENTQYPVIDTRKPGEYEAQHVTDAINIPLDSVQNSWDRIPQNTFYLHCAGGYRSVIMASLLKRKGIHHFINIEKGMAGIKNTSVATTLFSCPSTQNK